MRFDEKPRTASPAGGRAKPEISPKKLVVSYEGDQKARSATGPVEGGKTFRPPTQGQGKPLPPSQPRKQMKPQQAFNNPFAGLAALKDNLKK
jgi:hypothetical protein